MCELTFIINSRHIECGVYAFDAYVKGDEPEIEQVYGTGDTPIEAVHNLIEKLFLINDDLLPSRLIEG